MKGMFIMFSVVRSLTILAVAFGVNCSVMAMQDSPVNDLKYRGLRCEFPGSMKVCVLQKTYTQMLARDIKLRQENPGSLYDAKSVDLVSRGGVCLDSYQNGVGKRYPLALNSNDWIWVPTNAP